ncbi:MAG: aminomethyl-transferring glycine dehydrogenase subunit GcvPB [Deltaproteobacteria bacterium]|nr:aminomethyl-transferring glycine dehydrogenase subunit GcvPB [Deltaproteobacteria bacterium]
MVFEESLLFEKSSPGREGFSLIEEDLPQKIPLHGLESQLIRNESPLLPEVSEPMVVRHFTRLSQWNFSIDTGFYPLGSCTMKYNPRVNEEVARMSGFLKIHPYQPSETLQGALQLMYELEQYLAEISGMDAVTLQPAAGAQGEFTGLKLIRAYHQAKGNPRKKVLIPDTAHGTNPASSSLCGYEVVEIKSSRKGILAAEDVARLMNEEVAAIMITNPNTLGLFEENIGAIAEIVHSKGGFVYCDGANQNALVGQARVGDMGVDVLHFNLHKTFTTPHGGGGPGSGPVAVKNDLAPFLPVPRVVKKGKVYTVEYHAGESIGRVKSFFGNFGMLVRAYTYIREMGFEGLKLLSQMAVLNANYLRQALREDFFLPYDSVCMHECVFTDKWQNEQGVKTLDIAKRLMDYGFHPPTVYFPLVVAGSLMVEPTETESKETLDCFIAAMKAIAQEAKTAPEQLTSAPKLTALRRLDEVKAVRELKLVWKPSS